MKKISISSWAIPQPMDQLCKGAKELDFDGISLGGFPPFGAHPDLVDTPEKIEAFRACFQDSGLLVADLAIDLWCFDPLHAPERWRAGYTRALKHAKALGLTNIIRVDTVNTPVLPDGMTYDQVKAFFIKHFREMAQEAAGYGFEIVWEFEPGFIINEPSSIIEVVDAVNEPNFKLLFDTCHAYNCVLGLRGVEPEMLAGGMMQFIRMCKDRIGLVHLIDADGSLNATGTSEHIPFGDGKIDFDAVIPALLNEANYRGDWWAIDLCEWPDAWAVTASCKKAVDEINAKFCG